MADAKRNGSKAKPLGHRMAFFFVAAILVAIIAVLPFALEDVVLDVAQSANPTYRITSTPVDTAESQSHVNLEATTLDEWHRVASFNVSGHHICKIRCDWSDRFLFVSIPVSEEDGEGLPPSAEINFPPTTKEINQQISLPVSGDAIRYPFDHYGLRLAIVMQRIFATGEVQTLSPEQANGHLFVSVNGSVPRTVMEKPEPVDASKLFVDDPVFQYVVAAQLTFSRPLYLKILTVFLVILVSAAASYAIFMRPLHELVLNSGAIVLGVWGIRAIMLGANVPGFTLVDLSLMMVILFLLLAITWRALWYLHSLGDLSLPFFRGQRLERPPDHVLSGGEQEEAK